MSGTDDFVYGDRPYIKEIKGGGELNIYDFEWSSEQEGYEDCLEKVFEIDSNKSKINVEYLTGWQFLNYQNLGFHFPLDLVINSRISLDYIFKLPAEKRGLFANNIGHKEGILRMVKKYPESNHYVNYISFLQEEKDISGLNSVRYNGSLRSSLDKSQYTYDSASHFYDFLVNKRVRNGGHLILFYVPSIEGISLVYLMCLFFEKVIVSRSYAVLGYGYKPNPQASRFFLQNFKSGKLPKIIGKKDLLRDLGDWSKENNKIILGMQDIFLHKSVTLEQKNINQLKFLVDVRKSIKLAAGVDTDEIDDNYYLSYVRDSEMGFFVTDKLNRIFQSGCSSKQGTYLYNFVKENKSKIGIVAPLAHGVTALYLLFGLIALNPKGKILYSIDNEQDSKYSNIGSLLLSKSGKGKHHRLINRSFTNSLNSISSKYTGEVDLIVLKDFNNNIEDDQHIISNLLRIGGFLFFIGNDPKPSKDFFEIYERNIKLDIVIYIKKKNKQIGGGETSERIVLSDVGESRGDHNSYLRKTSTEREKSLEQGKDSKTEIITSSLYRPITSQLEDDTDPIVADDVSGYEPQENETLKKNDSRQAERIKEYEKLHYEIPDREEQYYQGNDVDVDFGQQFEQKEEEEEEFGKANERDIDWGIASSIQKILMYIKRDRDYLLDQGGFYSREKFGTIIANIIEKGGNTHVGIVREVKKRIYEYAGDKEIFGNFLTIIQRDINKTRNPIHNSREEEAESEFKRKKRLEILNSLNDNNRKGEFENNYGLYEELYDIVKWGDVRRAFFYFLRLLNRYRKEEDAPAEINSDISFLERLVTESPVVTTKEGIIHGIAIFLTYMFEGKPNIVTDDGESLSQYLRNIASKYEELSITMVMFGISKGFLDTDMGIRNQLGEITDEQNFIGNEELRKINLVANHVLYIKWIRQINEIKGDRVGETIREDKIEDRASEEIVEGEGKTQDDDPVGVEGGGLSTGEKLEESGGDPEVNHEAELFSRDGAVNPSVISYMFDGYSPSYNYLERPWEPREEQLQWNNKRGEFWQETEKQIDPIGRPITKSSKYYVEGDIEDGVVSDEIAKEHIMSSGEKSSESFHGIICVENILPEMENGHDFIFVSKYPMFTDIKKGIYVIIEQINQMFKKFLPKNKHIINIKDYSFKKYGKITIVKKNKSTNKLLSLETITPYSDDMSTFVGKTYDIGIGTATKNIFTGDELNIVSSIAYHCPTKHYFNVSKIIKYDTKKTKYIFCPEELEILAILDLINTYNGIKFNIFTNYDIPSNFIDKDDNYIPPNFLDEKGNLIIRIDILNEFKQTLAENKSLIVIEKLITKKGLNLCDIANDFAKWRINHRVEGSIYIPCFISEIINNTSEIDCDKTREEEKNEFFNNQISIDICINTCINYACYGIVTEFIANVSFYLAFKDDLSVRQKIIDAYETNNPAFFKSSIKYLFSHQIDSGENTYEYFREIANKYKRHLLKSDDFMLFIDFYNLQNIRNNFNHNNSFDLDTTILFAKAWLDNIEKKDEYNFLIEYFKDKYGHDHSNYMNNYFIPKDKSLIDVIAKSTDERFLFFQAIVIRSFVEKLYYYFISDFMELKIEDPIIRKKLRVNNSTAFFYFYDRMSKVDRRLFSKKTYFSSPSDVESSFRDFLAKKFGREDVLQIYDLFRGNSNKILHQSFVSYEIIESSIKKYYKQVAREPIILDLYNKLFSENAEIANAISQSYIRDHEGVEFGKGKMITSGQFIDFLMRESGGGEIVVDDER